MTKRAALGFKVIGLVGELQVPDERDFAQEIANRAYISLEKTRARKLRCYTKHASKYNAQKRNYAKNISNNYNITRRAAAKRGDGWEFTQDEWENAWISAGWIKIPGTQSLSNPTGDVSTAYALRGSHRYNNTCMQRLHTGKPWGPDNFKIMFRGQEVGPDNQWSILAPKV